eukprot:COSAG05_NODE_878_length_6804_cov_4.974944_4_plen_92_part_00
MHIETSADARQPLRHAAAPGGRGFLASVTSSFSSWLSGASRSPAPTADADLGAGPWGSNTADVRPTNGDANRRHPRAAIPPPLLIVWLLGT